MYTPESESAGIRPLGSKTEQSFRLHGIKVSFYELGAKSSEVTFCQKVTEAIRKVMSILSSQWKPAQTEHVITFEAPIALTKAQVKEVAPQLGKQLAEILGYTQPWNGIEHKFSFELELLYYHYQSEVVESVRMYGLHTDNRETALATWSKLRSVDCLPTPSSSSLSHSGIALSLEAKVQ